MFPDGLLSIACIEAENLIAADLNGKSDPYVLGRLILPNGVTCKRSQQKTFYVSKTLNPKWKETSSTSKTGKTNVLKFEIKSVPGRCSTFTGVRLDVMDHDMVGTDDFLGRVVLTWPEVLELSRTDGERWLVLSPKPQHPSSHVTGRVKISAHFSFYEDMMCRSCKIPQMLSDLGVPPMNVVILIVGSRGDVQPFCAFGLALQEMGHRVRIASHLKFTDFVRSLGLDFYPLRGDPETLMKYMSENPDMISLSPKKLREQRDTLKEIFDSVWLACTTPTLKSGDSTYKPDVIISNPPVAVHTHVSEKLSVPLQIMFTMPWEPTEMYRHPFSSFGPTKMLKNKDSYGAIDKLIWTGQSAMINSFRKRTLNLPAVSNGDTIVRDLRVPQTYCMSPHLVSKPNDWGPHVDVVGFWFLDLKSSFNPDATVPALVKWLVAGPPPFYVGFGSIVVDDPAGLNKVVTRAVQRARDPAGNPIRAILHSGWAKLGEGVENSDNVFVLEDAVPHDWLFPLCSAVCHHGGAGTLAAGLRVGKPTVVIPFFGDQPFWGSVVASKGVGPKPIFNTELSEKSLCAAIEFCYTRECINAAEKLGKSIAEENGVQAGVRAFHSKVPAARGVFFAEVFEYQKLSSGVWKQADRHYCDMSTLHQAEMCHVHQPPGWQWMMDWMVDANPNTDSDGWEYSSTGKPFKRWMGVAGKCEHRRRRWIRMRKPDPDYVPTPIKANALSKDVPATIVFHLDRCEKLPNPTATGGKPNPYMRLSCSSKGLVSQASHTKIVEHDANPVFKQAFYFKVLEEDMLELKCSHYDAMGKNMVLAKTLLPVKPDQFGTTHTLSLPNGGSVTYRIEWFEK